MIDEEQAKKLGPFWTLKVKKLEEGNKELTSERDYLWKALVTLETWAGTSPPDWVRLQSRLKEALDGFKPALKSERVAP